MKADTEPGAPLSRLMVVRAVVGLVVWVFLLGACSSRGNDANYPPEPVTARQLPPVDASPGFVAPSTPTATCVGPGRVTADRNPTLLCLRVGETATVVLPAAFGEWLQAQTDNSRVASPRRQRKMNDGGARFVVVADGVGTATITVQNPGTGEAPGRVAQVVVTVSG